MRITNLLVGPVGGSGCRATAREGGQMEEGEESVVATVDVHSTETRASGCECGLSAF